MIMAKDQHTPICKLKLGFSHKKHIKRSLAFICVFCFITTALLSSSMAMALANHEHASDPICLSSGDFVCWAYEDVLVLQADAPGLAIVTPHAIDYQSTDCIACVFFQKAVQQYRQPNFTSHSAATDDLCFFVPMTTYRSLFLSFQHSLIELKAKNSN